MFNAEKFDELIRENNESIEALAESAGVTRQTIWLLRQGHLSDPKLSTVQGLAAALGVEPSELIKEASAA